MAEGDHEIPLTDTVDLRTVGVPEGFGAPTVEPKRPFQEKTYDPAPVRENIRGMIALWLIWTLVGVIALAALAAIVITVKCLDATQACAAQASELGPLRVLVGLVLTPLVGLVGAVTGFYFGEKSAIGRESDGAA